MADEKRIKIKNMPTKTFRESIEALEAHLPSPVIHVAIQMQINGPDIDLRNFYRALVEVTGKYEVEMTTTVIGKFKTYNSNQMRLFAPPTDPNAERQHDFDSAVADAAQDLVDSIPAGSSITLSTKDSAVTIEGRD